MKELIITTKKKVMENVNKAFFTSAPTTRPGIPITAFDKEYEFLSNDYECEIPVVEDELVFTNITSALIAKKSNDIGTRRKFTRFSAAKARKKESSIPENDYWEENKDDILYDLLKIKFTHNKDLKSKLLATHLHDLINNVTYPDTYYGVRFGEGKNVLGKLLMKLREELRINR